MSLNESRVRKSIALYEDRMREFAGEGYEIEVLKEAYSNIVQDLIKFDEDKDWIPAFGNDADAVKGLSLKDLSTVVPYLEKQTKILGDLLGRGLRLKNNHVFGRGCRFEREGGQDIAPRFVKIMEDPKNKAAVFSTSAMKELNRILFTAGNIVVKYDKGTSRFTRIPIATGIENWISEDEDPASVKYFLHTWNSRDDLNSAQTTVKREWVPVSTYDATNPRYPDSIKVGGKPIPVNKNAVIVFKAVNKDDGEVFGVPDSFAAAPPAHVYASYMRDGAMLQHALAAIAFVVKAKTQTAARSAGAKLQSGKVAQAAITGPESHIQSLPRAGSINLYEGRPLAARVASALDVSTTGITSDTGNGGGSYNAENALSAPEQASALSRQDDFTEFFSEIFRVMGARDISVNWNRLDTDPIHRQLQSLGLARQFGFIHQGEGRDRTLELLDIEAKDKSMPEPDEFTGSKYASLRDTIVDQMMSDNEEPAGNGVASQGNSGAVGSLDDDNSARDDDNAAGTA